MPLYIYPRKLSARMYRVFGHFDMPRVIYRVTVYTWKEDGKGTENVFELFSTYLRIYFTISSIWDRSTISEQDHGYLDTSRPYDRGEQVKV